MKIAIKALRTSISRVCYLGGLHNAILSLTTRAIDPSDLLRAQVVLGVSALDYYVHEITVQGMIEVFEGKRTPTPAFLKYDISMNFVLGSIVGSGGSSLFESEVR